MARRYARGKHAVAECERSGFKIPYKYLVVEPGTGLRVDKRWSDGRWNLKDHPQNYPPKNLVDGLPLRYPTTDSPMTIVSVLSLEIFDENGNPILTETSVAITDDFDYRYVISYGS